MSSSSQHKERSQLANRSKFGILEKHKDYVQRARDYHSKQLRLARLRQKAADRNKDEFYFSMTKQKTLGGVHIKDRGNVALPTDFVKVLKTQDENYVRTVRATGLKKIDKLKRQLMEMADLLHPTLSEEEVEVVLEEQELRVLVDAGIISQRKTRHKKPKHIIYVDNPEDAARYTNPQATKQKIVADHPIAESPPDLGWKSTELKKKKPSAAIKITDAPQSDSQNKKRLLKELSARLLRDKQLRYAEREFEMQRLMMGKGARKKIEGVEKMEGDEEDEEDQDEIDARKGKRRSSLRKVDEATYKPRVYKWRLERKK